MLVYLIQEWAVSRSNCPWHACQQIIKLILHLHVSSNHDPLCSRPTRPLRLNCSTIPTDADLLNLTHGLQIRPVPPRFLHKFASRQNNSPCNCHSNMQVRTRLETGQRSRTNPWATILRMLGATPVSRLRAKSSVGQRPAPGAMRWPIHVSLTELSALDMDGSDVPRASSAAKHRQVLTLVIA